MARSKRAVRGLGLLLGATLTASLATPVFGESTPRASAPPTASWPAASWSVATGPIAESSPTVATYDGTTFAAVGSENGRVYVVNVATGQELPGFPVKMADGPGQKVAIEASPAIGYLDGPGVPPSIVVGSASTWVPNNVGEVEAFSFTGKSQWVFHVGHATGTNIGVVSSPAIGDVTGSGQQDVVFGSWDHKIYALTPSGAVVAGFPFDNADTIWSSPALYQMPGQAGEDIFLGSDASGVIYSQGGASHTCHSGGFIGDYRYKGHALVPAWRDCENQTIWSSPAIAKFGSTPVVVVGTGFFEQPFPSETNEVFAVYAATGAAVPGWPVKTSGPTFGSPAIGNVNGNLAVVDTSWVCTAPHVANCLPPAGPNTSKVNAWSPSGQLLWSDSILGGEDFSSPVLAPLQGESTNDVLVGSTNGLYPIAGANGLFLYGTNTSSSIDDGCEMLNAAAVVNVAGGGGWHVVQACGGPARPSKLVAYALPLPIPPGVKPGWPMFRHGPNHGGVS